MAKFFSVENREVFNTPLGKDNPITVTNPRHLLCACRNVAT